jgi:hypothetical protein
MYDTEVTRNRVAVEWISTDTCRRMMPILFCPRLLVASWLRWCYSRTRSLWCRTCEHSQQAFATITIGPRFRWLELASTRSHVYRSASSCSWCRPCAEGRSSRHGVCATPEFLPRCVVSRHIAALLVVELLWRGHRAKYCIGHDSLTRWKVGVRGAVCSRVC